MAMMHGGQIMARALKNEGVDMVFALTGGHIMGFLDGCVLEGIKIIDVRHEQSAAHAAEAYTRLTGKLGVAAVTAGPGVTDTVTGVATAFSSGTPMLVIGGRHLVRQEQMGGLQEMEHPRIFDSITKWSGTAWQTERLAESMSLAVRHTFEGRGGPVFIDVPMDIQLNQVEESEVLFPTNSRPNSKPGVDDVTLEMIASALAGARQPMVFGGGALRAENPADLATLVEAMGAPTYLNSRARGTLPHGHPLLGNSSRSVAFASADVVLALGVDWDFRTGYGRKISPDATVIQIDPDGSKIGWNRPAHIGVVADPAAVVGQLAKMSSRFGPNPNWVTSFDEWESAGRDARGVGADSDDSPVMPARFAKEVADFFGNDSVVAVDGGDIVSTTARWLQTSTPGHLVDPGPFGALGVGPGYPIAAKVAFPDKRVGLVMGDGAFGFNGMDFDTMVRHGLPVIGVVGNDGVWSNIKTVHMAFFPERVVASDLGVQRYDKVVEALGGYGEFVTDPKEIRPALERAAASGLPSLINVHIAETRRMSSNYTQ